MSDAPRCQNGEYPRTCCDSTNATQHRAGCRVRAGQITDWLLAGPDSDPRSCATCRYWDDEFTDRSNPWGVCNRADDNDAAMGVMCDAWGTGPINLETRPDFGCTEHSPHPEPTEETP